MAQVGHHVYFKLVDRSDQAIEALLGECRKYLADPEGVGRFASRTRDREQTRAVTQDFDVSLHWVYEDRPAHDAYQVSERHVKFIEENKDAWASVRVFDTILK